MHPNTGQGVLNTDTLSRKNGIIKTEDSQSKSLKWRIAVKLSRYAFISGLCRLYYPILGHTIVGHLVIYNIHSSSGITNGPVMFPYQ